MKTSFLAVVIAPVHFFLTSYSTNTAHANFDLNWGSIFTECWFYLALKKLKLVLV